MAEPFKQHLIDPEICIRCHTCEEMCTVGAISHDDNNVVVDASKCGYCMDCIAPCPTGAIDNWRVVNEPYSLEEQLGWMDLPEQEEISSGDGSADGPVEALDEAVIQLLEEAHRGAGGKVLAPASASKPVVNLYNASNPLEVEVQGNYRLTEPDSDSDVRHIILNMGETSFPVLEGQSIGIIVPGTDDNGNAHAPRLFSISSPRSGERPNTNNLSLTIKREENGLCSNYVCDLAKGDRVEITGPFGATFLLPDDPQAKLLMVCTGTGAAPFRGFTMQRQRTMPGNFHAMQLFFGARTPQSLPYFGPLAKVPDEFLKKHFAFSRVRDAPKEYVQDKLLAAAEDIIPQLGDPNLYVYICGLKAMEEGVEEAFAAIAKQAEMNWNDTRNQMREDGRYHVETY